MINWHRVASTLATVVAMVSIAVVSGWAQPGALENFFATTPTAGITFSPEALMAMPSGAGLGRESEEPEKPLFVFKSKEEITRLLGDDPRFVYDPRGLRDPMIVPWIRRDIIVSELLADAQELIKRGVYEEALKKLQDILEKYPTSKHTEKVKSEIKSVQSILAQVRTQTIGDITQRAVTLPRWIASNTKGVLWDPEKPLVMLGDYLLAKGDMVPGYEVTIVDIQQKTVVYEIEDVRFSVEVKSLE